MASQGNLYSTDEKKGGRRKNYDSSAESATEGDSSQHSTRSMIYLHAATGKIRETWWEPSYKVCTIHIN